MTFVSRLLDVQRLTFFATFRDIPLPSGYRECMTFALAFADLDAAAPRQRARCAATGRFVAWSKVPQLRVPGAPRVIVIPAPVVEVVEVAEVAPAAPVAEVAPVAVADGAVAEVAPPAVAALLNGVRAAGASLVAGAAALVGAAGRWFRSKASALVAGARAAVAAGALAIGDGAPPVSGGAAAGGAPPVVEVERVTQ